MPSLISSVLNRASSLASRAVSSVSSAVSSAWNTASSLASRAVSSVSSLARTAYNSARNYITRTVTPATRTVANIASTIARAFIPQSNVNNQSLRNVNSTLSYNPYTSYEPTFDPRAPPGAPPIGEHRQIEIIVPPLQGQLTPEEQEISEEQLDILAAALRSRIIPPGAQVSTTDTYMYDTTWQQLRPDPNNPTFTWGATNRIRTQTQDEVNEQNQGLIGNQVYRLTGGRSSSLLYLLGLINPMFARIPTIVQDLQARYEQANGNILLMLRNMAGDFGAGLEEIANGVGRSVDSAKNWIVDNIRATIRNTLDSLSPFLNKIVNALNSLPQTFANTFINNVQDFLLSEVGKWRPTLSK